MTNLNHTNKKFLRKQIFIAQILQRLKESARIITNETSKERKKKETKRNREKYISKSPHASCMLGQHTLVIQPTRHVPHYFRSQSTA